MDVMFSIVIPCYLIPDKDCELLGFTQNCILSIRRYCTDYELILIDNGSTVGQDYLLNEADRYVRNSSNLGFAPAVNQGLKLACGTYITVCNNDVEFLHDWLSLASDAFDEKTGAVSSHLHDHDPLHRVGREPVKYGSMFGALWMTKREVLNDVGLLDEGYIVGMYEDRDFFLRIQRAGYELAKIGWCNHVGNATWGKMPNQHETFMQNKRRFEEKLAQAQ